MKKRLVLLFLFFVLLISIPINAEEKGKSTSLQYNRKYFVNMLVDSHRIITTQYRGDNAVVSEDLITGAIEYVSKVAEKKKDALLSEFAKTIREFNTLDFKIFLEKSRTIEIEGLDWQQATDYVIEGMLRALNDPFSRYFTLEEFRSLTNSLASGMKDYYGMIPSPDGEGGFKIAHLRYGSSSFFCGLVVGDSIVAIDGKDINDLKRSELVKYFGPSEPCPLVLDILRDGWSESQRVTIPANPLGVPVVIGGMANGKIGYIRPTIYSNDVAKKSLVQLEAVKEKAKAYILDLRNNPGGSAGGAVELCDIFLRGKKLVTSFKMMKAEYGLDVPMLAAGKTYPYENVPLVCLVNESSASASEMTSGALQDHKRATILGKTTYGKGCAQAPLGVPCSRGTRFLYLTIAKYFLPSKRTIHKLGVTPDIEVSDGPEGYRTREFFSALNSEIAQKFANSSVKRRWENCRKIVFSISDANISALPGYGSAHRKLVKQYPNFADRQIDIILRQSIFAAYALQTRDIPPFDKDDRVFTKAVERLEKETGLQLSH